MRETRYNKLHGHKLLVAQRRAELTRMMMEDPERKWSVRDMASEALKREWFRAHWPTYSKSTAHLDYRAVMEDLKESREEMASYYIEEHLDSTDLMLRDLEDDLESIEKEESVIASMISALEDRLESSDPDDKDIDKIIDELNKLIKSSRGIRKERRDIQSSMLSVMRRQATLVPIQVPFEQKGVNVQVNNVQLTLDDFHKEKARLRHGAQFSIPERAGAGISVVDGDYEEVELEENQEADD